MDECRHFYDQFAVKAPLLLFLTATTSATRILFTDTEIRLAVTSSGMNDRTSDDERDGAIPNSHYSSINYFLSLRAWYKPETYDDLPVPIN